MRPTHVTAGLLLCLAGLLCACATTPSTRSPGPPRSPPLEVTFEQPARALGELGSEDPAVQVRASGAIAALVTQGRGHDGADLLLLRSHDGDHYDAPLQINAERGEVSSHAEGSPQLLAGPGMRLCALWLAHPKTREGGLRLACSKNAGEQFGAPVEVVTGSPPSFFAGVVSSTGTIVVTWFTYAETGQPGTAQLWMTSTRDGRSFTAPAQIAADVCPCCRPALAADGRGLLVAWRHVEHGQMRDIVIARSEDDGKQWSTPSPVSVDGWRINGCPHSGPALLSAAGGVYAAWLSGAGDRLRVFWARSEDGGRHFGPRQPLGPGLLDGNHPSLAALGSRVFAAFEARDPQESKGWGTRHVFLQDLATGQTWRAPASRAAGNGAASRSSTYAVITPLSPEALAFAWTEVGEEDRQAFLSRVRITAVGQAP